MSGALLFPVPFSASLHSSHISEFVISTENYCDSSRYTRLLSPIQNVTTENRLRDKNRKKKSGALIYFISFHFISLAISSVCCSCCLQVESHSCLLPSKCGYVFFLASSVLFCSVFSNSVCFVAYLIFSRHRKVRNQSINQSIN